MLRRHLTPSGVISLIALFVLGSSSGHRCRVPGAATSSPAPRS